MSKNTASQLSMKKEVSENGVWVQLMLSHVFFVFSTFWSHGLNNFNYIMDVLGAEP